MERLLLERETRYFAAERSWSMLFRQKHTCLVSFLCPSLVTCLLLESLKRKRLKTHSHVFRIPTEDNPNSRSQFHSRKLSCRLETAVPSSCLPMTSSTKWRQVRGSGLRQTSHSQSRTVTFLRNTQRLSTHAHTLAVQCKLIAQPDRFRVCYAAYTYIVYR